MGTGGGDMGTGSQGVGTWGQGHSGVETWGQGHRGWGHGDRVTGGGDMTYMDFFCADQPENRCKGTPTNQARGSGVSHVVSHVWRHTCGVSRVASHVWRLTCGVSHVASHMWCGDLLAAVTRCLGTYW